MDVVKKALFLIIVLGICAGGYFYSSKKSNDRAQNAVQSHMEFDYAYDKREVFNDDVSSDLTEMDTNIEKLSEKAASADAAVKTNAQSKIQNLSAERAVLGKKLDALKNANESNWNALKTDFQKSEDQMKSSLRETWQCLGGKTPS